MPKTPEKYVPGADYVDTKKSRRRKKKTTTNDESTEAGPSSSLPPPSSSQSSYGNVSLVQETPVSSGPGPNASSNGARPPEQISNLPTPGTSYASRSTQPPIQTAGVSSRLAGSDDTTPPTSTGPQPRKTLPLIGGPGQKQSIEDPTSTGPQPRKTLPLIGGPKQKQSIEDPTNISSEAIKHVPHQGRPGAVGSQGRIVPLSTNYFKMTIEPGLILHRYSIRVSPEMKGRKLAEMIKTALKRPPFDSPTRVIFSDFAAFLLSKQPLPDKMLSVSIPYRNYGSTSGPNDTEGSSKCVVNFDHVRTVDISTLSNIQRTSVDQGSLEIVQSLDIVLGHYRRLAANVEMIGKRKAFNLETPERCTLAEGNRAALFEAVRGFFSSVRLSSSGLLVNVNVTHGSFFLQRNGVEWFPMLRNHPEVHRTRTQGVLKGLRVELLHLQPEKVIKTISGYASPGQGRGYEAHPPRVLRFEATPKEVEFFEYKTTKPVMDVKDKELAKNGGLVSHTNRCGCQGSYTSVLDYFRRKYPEYEISENLPVVNVGSTQHPSYLPLSVVSLLRQPAKLKLSSNETKLMQNFAVRHPQENADSISHSGFSTLDLRGEKLQNLGITIHPDRVKLNGHILPQPTVVFSKIAAFNGKSQWDLKGMKFKSAKKLGEWACLNIYRGKSPQPCHDECVKNFVNVVNACGIGASIPPTTHLSNDNPRELESKMRKCGVPFLLVVLPSNGSQLYNQIKQLADVKCGIQTLCVVGTANKFYNIRTTTFRGKVVLASTQYNANVALKLNIKNNGVNHELASDQLGFISKGQTMVVGIDVTHPSPGSGPSATSVAAMVASSDENLAQWPAEIRINPARQEKVNTLRPMLEAHLIRWKLKHGSFPEKLLIYRDGVSEGQYQMVLDEEIPHLRNACAVYGGEQAPPRMTVIVVGKRHHTRFYRTDKATGGIPDEQAGNPPFGTVVDTVIVEEKRNWDFYLQSHTAFQGTARPAHYFVLVDEIFIKEPLPRGFKNPSDLLYSITHNMCYLFCRATTSVSIPPAVYYADLACERGRRWNSQVFDMSERQADGQKELQDRDVKVHERLKDTMFYI